jgi:uncharacterized membrane protein
MNILQAIKRRSKNYFISGLLLVVPLVITILVIRAIFTFLDSLLLPYLRPYVGEWISIPGVGILITVLSIYVIGILVTNIIGRKFVNLGEQILLRIPIAKSIYGSVKQIVQTFSFKEDQSGKNVAMVEYPKEGIWSIGLVNGEISHPENGESMYSILILASINPTSGFFIMVPKKKTIMLGISVEEAMKWIVSGGIVTPEHFKDKADVSLQTE